jgi:hypothetical protein
MEIQKGQAMTVKNLCPCCGLYEHDTPPGNDDVCPVCWWEDNRLQREQPYYSGAANDISLYEAQARFAQGLDCLGNPLAPEYAAVVTAFVQYRNSTANKLKVLVGQEQ